MSQAARSMSCSLATSEREEDLLPFPFSSPCPWPHGSSGACQTVFTDGFDLLTPHKALHFFFRINLLPNWRGELPRGGTVRPPKLGQGEQQDFGEWMR